VFELSANPPPISLYVYPSTIRVGALNQKQIEMQAKNIESRLHLSSLLRRFQIIPRLFEHYNIRYSEKQIKRIDENFYDYSLGTKFGLNVPIQNPPRSLRYLIRKFFSGDVSGDIAESLFVYFLVEEMSVNPYEIGHTRPDKRRRFLTPDFLIWDNSFRLASILSSKTYPLPVLAEVKGFTSKVDAPRISHGLGQLKALIANSLFVGILFLGVRNQTRQGYDAYLIEVRV